MGCETVRNALGSFFGCIGLLEVLTEQAFQEQIATHAMRV